MYMQQVYRPSDWRDK